MMHNTRPSLAMIVNSQLIDKIESRVEYVFWKMSIWSVKRGHGQREII